MDYELRTWIFCLAVLIWYREHKRMEREHKRAYSGRHTTIFLLTMVPEPAPAPVVPSLLVQEILGIKTFPTRKISLVDRRPVQRVGLAA